MIKTLLPLSWPQLRAVLLLENPPYEALRNDRHAVRNGILLIVFIALIAGSLAFVVNLFQGNRSLVAARQSITQARENLNLSLANVPPDLRAQIIGYLDATDNMVRELAGVRPRLGRPVANFFQALGQLVSQPFAWLGGYLGYLLWVLLFARLLGGRGSLSSSIGATSLFAIPHLLDFFAPIPVLGALLSFVATLWGIIIYIKAIEVSQRFSLGKAVLATLLPAVLLFLLIAAIFFFVIIVAAIGGAGSRSFMMPGLL